MTLAIFVRFFPTRGQEAMVESILRGMVVATRNEPGCHRYDLYQAVGGSGEKIFCLVEEYVDQDAVQSHRETPHYKEYRASIMALLAQPIEVTMLEKLDVRQS